LSEVLLRMENIKKRFCATQALAGVDFEVKRGEVHVLLGENGAGKSTLMKILSGACFPDEGKIYWNNELINIKNPAFSINLGIGMVYQELTLVKNLSVFENIYLGQLPRTKFFPFVLYGKAQKGAKDILATLGVDIDVNLPLKKYDLGIQQLIEIARAISRNAKLIILDEPTSALTELEVNNLFKAIHLLKKQGVSFIYITHKLNEVFEIGDRVTVLRDGNSVGNIDKINEAKEDGLIKMMVGRTIDEQYPKVCNRVEEVVMSVKSLSVKNCFSDASFDLRKGEVLGIAGLEGAGRTDLAEALFGMKKIAGGSLTLYSKKYIPKDPFEAIKSKIGFLTKDRKCGLLLHMPIFQNITVACPDGFSEWGFRKTKKEIDVANEYIKQLKVNTKDVKMNIGNLSGGNQQKIAIAKWFCSKCQIFIMDEPTRGIDVGAKVEVYKLINQITKEGASVILISSEMPELLGMSDRVLVMRKGKIVGNIDIGDCSQELIMQKAAGGNN